MNPLAFLLAALVASIFGARGCNGEGAPPEMPPCAADAECSSETACIPDENGEKVCCPYRGEIVNGVSVCPFSACGSEDGPSTEGSCACDAECPPRADECHLAWTCVAGKCESPAAVGGICSTGVCTADGTCERCVTDDECRNGAADECFAYACGSDGTCKPSAIPVGMPCLRNPAGTCNDGATCVVN